MITMTTTVIRQGKARQYTSMQYHDDDDINLLHIILLLLFVTVNVQIHMGIERLAMGNGQWATLITSLMQT